jgi:eukaryotic-like serine/threonine-protein kinase
LTPRVGTALLSYPASARFDVVERIGQGAMGVVYRARDRETGREFALKTFLSFTPADVYQIKREFRSLADVAHPHLVQLNELFVGEDHCFFTMELVDGVNFRDFVRSADARGVPEGVPVDHGRVRDALRQLAAGLNALHARGKLHRDIKPPNVLVDRGERVVLLDFGFVSDLDSRASRQSRDGNFVGTLAYMAPEQIRGESVSPASDWYSVGIMLYECLTGQLPFEGPGLAALLDRGGPPPSPRACVPETPADLDELTTALLTVEPSGRPTGEEVIRLLASAEAASPPAASDNIGPAWTPRPPFVGRRSELDALREAFEATRRGKAAVVRLAGVSGIGKTALVERFLAGQEEAPATVVLRSRCHPQESVTFKALDAGVDALSRVLVHQMQGCLDALVPRNVSALVRLFPVLGRVPFPTPRFEPAIAAESPQALRRRGFAALRELFGRLSERSPVVLWIDDLQWGDMDSAAAIQELLRPPDPPPFLLLLSYRLEDRANNVVLAAIESAEGGQRISLEPELIVGPLHEADACELSRRLLPRETVVDAGTVAQIATESLGSPFLIGQLVHSLASRTDGGLGRSREPVHVADVVADRVSYLPDSERRILVIVAVGGGPLERNVALAASEVIEEGQQAASSLCRRGLLRLTTLEGRAALDVYHERVREGVLLRLTDVERVGCHRVLATLLEVGGQTEPEILARHFYGSGDLEKAASYAAAAGDKAARAFAFAQAAAFYQQALEWRPGDEAWDRTLLVARANALVNAGRCAQAAPLFLQAASGAPSDEALELRRRAAEQLLVSGRVDDGVETLRPLLRQLGFRYPSTTNGALISTALSLGQLWLRGTSFRCRAESDIRGATLRRADLCFSAAKGLIAVDTLRAGNLAFLGLLAALRAGEPTRVGRHSALVAAILTPFGGAVGAFGQRMIDSAKRIARERGDGYLDCAIALIEGYVAMAAGDWATALARSDAGVTGLRASFSGINWECNMGTTVSLRALEELGQFGESLRRSETLAAEARDLGDHYGAITAAHYTATARIAGGDIESALDQLRWALARWSQAGFHIQHFYALRGEVYADMHRGDVDRAWHRVREAWPALAHSGLLQVPIVDVDARLLRARVALAAASQARGREREALRICSVDVRRLARKPRADTTAHCALIRAGIATIIGDAAAARAELDAAIRIYEHTSLAMYRACARRRLGEMLGGNEARWALEESDALLRANAIHNPERWIAIIAPGFERAGSG